MASISQADFRNRVRFLFNDTITSNYVQRERLVDRPGNGVDGINKIFYLLNRRIVSLSLYDINGNAITGYTPSLPNGSLLFTAAPIDPNMFVDYYWQKLTDAEMDTAIEHGRSSAGFTSGDLDTSYLDFAGVYCLAFCYLAAASKAAEYYTISAAGKQVSKSELFNHYMSMYQQTLNAAQQLRTDHYTDRGLRQVPAEYTTAPEYVQPYLLDSNE
jgi:hypothetical protein